MTRYETIDAFPVKLEQGSLNNESFELLLSLTSIRSEPLIEALRDHYVGNLAKEYRLYQAWCGQNNFQPKAACHGKGVQNCYSFCRGLQKKINTCLIGLPYSVNLHCNLLTTVDLQMIFVLFRYTFSMVNGWDTKALCASQDQTKLEKWHSIHGALPLLDDIDAEKRSRMR